MRDRPQHVPEEESIREQLKEVISRDVDRAVSEHNYLRYLEPEEIQEVKSRAFELVMSGGSLPSSQNSDLDNLIFGSIHKALKEKRPWMDYEDLPGTSIEDLNESGVDREKAVAEMTAIIQENYKEKPAEFRAAVLESFNSALNNPDSHFIIARKGTDIIAFCRFDYHIKPKSDAKDSYGDELDYIYFGSVNLDPKFKGSRIGESMIHLVLDDVLDDFYAPLRADCQAYGNTAMNYIEKNGFVAKRFYDFHGVPSLEIEHSTDYYFLNRKKISEKDVIRLQA